MYCYCEVLRTKDKVVHLLMNRDGRYTGTTYIRKEEV
jgi:hypothetical protein